jgi:hypothetical protein
MATTPTEEMSLEEMLLERIERTTDPATKTEIMKRLELSQFMNARYADRNQFLEQIKSEACKHPAKDISKLSHEVLLHELQTWLRLSQGCESKHAMAKIQIEASQVLGQIIASMWLADAELKCED